MCMLYFKVEKFQMINQNCIKTQTLISLSKVSKSHLEPLKTSIVLLNIDCLPIRSCLCL